MNLNADYVEWLHKIPSNRGVRGQEYWTCVGDEQKIAEREEKKGNPNAFAIMSQKKLLSAREGRKKQLCLSELSDWSVGPLVDIGANLTKCQAGDLARQLVRAGAAGVSHVLLTGTSPKVSLKCAEMCHTIVGGSVQSDLQTEGANVMSEMASFLSEKQRQGVVPKVWFTAGVHPHDAIQWDENSNTILLKLLEDPFCVALGEFGLDYDRMFSPKQVQLDVMRKHLELLNQLGPKGKTMPLFLHERESSLRDLGSSEDMLRLLDEFKIAPSRVCIHCFTGPEETLQEYVSRGYFIGFTGFIGMLKRGDHLRKVLKDVVPLSQLLIETDCPFMRPDNRYLTHPDGESPLGFQGKRMEPAGMVAVCRAVAEVYEISPEELAEVTTKNAVSFFKLRTDDIGMVAETDGDKVDREGYANRQ